ncbi:murein hydrolase activator EnvC family protein [Altericroceibacterium endophyticum]|uniref:Peptidoglycan DD-metalloendopeptidase family protein n=1 Tax=Altericroceibacterium endophyticum TaxID=1808508 RepID=A0A6I4T6R6_9SPHN|nr:peptidoglycan DD-metalloendopeptidase family protein [Altericroceibacterium endophyticum]MXO65693.1 peptidoglycan DD-metalloendopeptidase family protein [Altericroceibacterium endophyticum]
MMRRTRFWPASCLIVALPLCLSLAASGQGEDLPLYSSNDAIQADWRRAQADQKKAAQRGADLAKRAAQAADQADELAMKSAGLAANIQAAEAAVAEAEARLALARREQQALERDLGEKQRPLIGLTGGLQRIARRPVLFGLARPGDLRETVYLQATLAAIMPDIQHRTRDLRNDLRRSAHLRAEAAEALAQQRKEEARRLKNRARLQALEQTRRDLASKNLRAARLEQERALSLAERAQDLQSLSDEFERRAQLRDSLAALPGPVLRPEPGTTAAQPAARQSPRPQPQSTQSAGKPAYILPANGRIVTGFGAKMGNNVSQGLVLTTQGGAQIIAPAKARIAFAGPYRGYDRIIILEHDAGWTTLITGLGDLSVKVGDTVIAGAPIGHAENRNPSVMIELRHKGEPVNPLSLID